MDVLLIKNHTHNTSVIGIAAVSPGNIESFCDHFCQVRIDGLVQGGNNSSALTMESLKSCAKPPIFSVHHLLRILQML